MLFQDGEESLRVDVTGYEFPDGGGEPESDDRNWLILRGTWRRDDGEIRKDSGAYLMTYELQELTAGLKILNVGIRNAYGSDFLSHGFALSAQSAEGGRFRVSVSFYLENTMDGDDTAELSCELDKAGMKALIDELDQLCRKFPERT